MRLIPATWLLLMVLGCAMSLVEFREIPTQPLADIPGSKDAVTACLKEQLEKEKPASSEYRLMARKEGVDSIVSYWMASSVPIMSAASPSFELLVSQQAADVVRIEERHVSSAVNLVSAARGLIQRCRSASTGTAG